MLNGTKLLDLLIEKHFEEFLIIKSYVDDNEVSLVELIEFVQKLTKKCSGISAVHLKYFCLPLLSRVAEEYYTSPDDFLHLEIEESKV